MPFLTTKLYIPPPHPTLVARPRLIKRLNAGLQGKLTLITAPAGYGKTTLLSEWIPHTNRPIAWVSLDESDNEVEVFWTYFIAALQTIQKDLGENILKVLQYPAPPSVDTLLPELINEIAASSLPIALILDDFHTIKNRRINNTLTYFLDNMPPQMHLIISSRSDPPWPIAHLRGRREMAELHAKNLRFTSEETATFLNNVMGLNLSPEKVTALENRTEGWITGLQMAALSMQGREDIAGFIEAFTGSHRFILDYLMEEVLEQQSPRIQAFLLKTSILGRMTGSLCDAVLDDVNSQLILEQLEETNLFIVHLDDKRCWYRYHHLFAELLRNQLTLTHPQEISALHQRASAWLEAEGLTEETIQHAFAAKDNEQAARLIEKYAQEMLQQSKHSLLSSWIEALPHEIIQNRPWLCVYQSWTRHWAGQREGGEDSLNNAERTLKDAPFLSAEEKRILPGYIATVRAHYALVNGEIPRVIEQSQKSLQLVPPTDYYTRSTIGVALGGAYWGKGEILNAAQAFRECASSALKGGYQQRASSALCYQGMMQVRQAKLLQAEETFQKAFELSLGPGGRRFPVSGYSLAKLGELACEWDELDKAHPLVTDAITLCTQLGHVDLIAEAYAALARVQLAMRDFTGAQNTLQQADQLSQGVTLDPWAMCWLDKCRLRLWIATDKLDRAIRWTETSGLKLDDEFSFHHDLHHINLARVLIAQITQTSSPSTFDKVSELLARLLKTAKSAGWVHKEIKILVLQALALYAMKDGKEALTALTQALTLSEPGGYIRTFINEGAPMGSLLHQALIQGIKPTYAYKLMMAFEEDTRIHQEKSALADPLTDREIEVLRLLATPLSATEIAAKLVVSVHTVRSHTKSIYSKMGVHSRIQAVDQAKETGVL